MKEKKYKNVKVARLVLRILDTRKYDLSINTAQGAIDLVREHYEGMDKEMVMVIGMTAGHPSVIHVVSIGTIDTAPLNPRDVFKILLLSNSTEFILVHNHTTGHLEPSKADIDMTDRLSVLGAKMGINLVDHIILGYDGTYYSFRMNNRLITLTEKEKWEMDN